MSPPSAVSSIGGKILGAEIPPLTVTWPELKCISLRSMHTRHTVKLGWVNVIQIHQICFV